LYKGQDAAQILNLMRYDAMTLGNHEFDNGEATLGAFLKALKIPVVNTNIDFSKSKTLANLVKPYIVVNVGKEQIGIIGLITPDTPEMASPGQLGDLTFGNDLVGITQKAVDELTAKGVNKIILLSHIGYDVDADLATKVKGVDVIVGGHSHTLLSNTYKNAKDVYPVVAKSASEEPVLIVQAEAYLKYVGRLDVQFDDKGVLTKWGGDTILLSRYISPEMGADALVARLAAPMAKFKSQKVGVAEVRLEGDRKVCRAMECNMGDLATDAIRDKTKAQIVIINGGGIRATIDKGDISMGSVLEVFPFGNLISTFQLKGEDVITALENGVSKIEEGAGRFPQVSGIKYSFDATKPAGSRIVTVEVYNDTAQKFEPLDKTATYSMASIDFMRSGGDGYTVFKDKAVDPYDFGDPMDAVFAEYIKAHSPINVGTDGRITDVNKK
jgi:5'-nucleotidase